MTFKMQEDIRKIELLTTIALFVATETISNDIMPAYLTSKLIYLFDFIFTGYTERFTKEYKEMKEIYSQIIKNIAVFYSIIDINNPVSIFTVYVYMYRSGLLSYNNNFKYSGNMKDFPKLSGVDIIRGKGACRSISSMLTDIYNDMGMNAQNLAVNVNPQKFKIANKRMISVDMNYDIINKKNVSYKIAHNVKILSNHQINMVQQNDFNYIFDPTNVFFLISNGNKLIFDNNIDCYMKIDNLSGIVNKFSGQMAYEYNSISDRKRLLLDTISREEYEKIYLKTFKFCIDNKLLFNDFFLKNASLINDLYLISEQQHSLIRRKIPLLRSK